MTWLSPSQHRANGYGLGAVSDRFLLILLTHMATQLAFSK